MQKRVYDCENIEVLYNHETKELNGQEVLESVTVFNNITKEEKIIPCTGFFVAIGHSPSSLIFQNQLDMNDAGYIFTAADSTKTNINGVFAAGDVTDDKYRQAVTAAGMGCMAALEVEEYLSE